LSDFTQLLKHNRNYRFTWVDQIVSEAGDHFNNVAVLDLTLRYTHSGFAVAGIMLSRAIPAIFAGPVAGVLLDRYDRRRIMIASDLLRAVIALGFIAAVGYRLTWLLYVLSALLMGASPFFTAGRSAILPSIASKDELHTANSLTQTTGWITLTIGAYFGGTTVAQFGYQIAFVFNSLSFSSLHFVFRACAHPKATSAPTISPLTRRRLCGLGRNIAKACVAWFQIP
jgi:MFS family permease